MPLTLEDVDKRLLALEQQVVQLRQLFDSWMANQTSAQRGAELLREAKASQAAWNAGIAKAFAEMGITGEPIGAENVQQMIRACGINPEDNEFSREIIAMREE